MKRVIPIALIVLAWSGNAFAQQPPPWPDSPAKAADPPSPYPNGQDAPPMSAQGTDLVPSTPVQPPPVVMVAPKDDAADAKTEERFRDLEARITADEERLKKDEGRLRILKNLHIGAYVQPQYLVTSYNAAASPNLVNGALPAGIDSNDVIAKSDGTTTNGNMFRLRRTRLRTSFSTEVARLYLELDPFPVGGAGPGIGTVVRDAEATGIAHWTRHVRTDFGAGVFMVPMDSELLERSDVRPFIERSWAVQNVFPAERDIGAHAKTYAFADRLQVDLGVVNGQRLGQPRFVAEPDLNKSKDLYAQARFRMHEITFGVAGYLGRGEIVDPNALRFKQYDRWWVDYSIAAHHRFSRSLGESHVILDLAVAQNMDTGVNYAFAVPRIPQVLGQDVANLDERALIIRLEQEITRHALIGYRYDFYSPDTALKNNARDTHAFVTVLRFSQNLRWMNELDYAIDNVHDGVLAAQTGLGPPSKHILSFSSVLQASF